MAWLWESDDGEEFKPFSSAYSGMVETAYAKDPTQKWECKMRGHHYEFDFKKMVQKNTETGSKRRIKRTGPAPAEKGWAIPVGGIWQWQDDDHVWKKFDGKTAKALEAGAVKGETSVDMKLRGWDYTFDLREMLQVNNGTGKKRKIRSVSSGGGGGGGGAAAAASPVKSGIKHKAVDEGDDPPPAKSAKHHEKSWGGEKVIKKGNGIVDKYSGLAEKGHVLEDGKDVWMCTLNQTNIGPANNNKFYVIQTIEADGGGKWWTWNRWGRVGAVGQSKLQEFPSKDSAKADFMKKFREKTRNDWHMRDKFVKHDGKYQLMDMDTGDDDPPSVAAAAAAAGAKVPDSTLPPRVGRVMEMISDRKVMISVMKEMEIDVKKMPLGKISKKQVKDAFAELKKIDVELSKHHPDSGVILKASSQFYTLVPHDVGYCKLASISTRELLDKKMQMLDALADLEIAARVLSEAAKMPEHPWDAAYAKMKTTLTPLDKESEAYGLIREMAKGTHGKTHNSYTLSVMDVFNVERAGEKERYAPYSKKPNRVMLWHGSRVTNWMGILSQGLRIAPPEAPVTGYMFGKGVYFADVISKSANYCHCSPGKGKDVGFLLLSEVCLGGVHELTEAKFLDKAPGSCLSVKGKGKFEPKGCFTGSGGEQWPQGPMGDGYSGHTALLYNEFIVYDVAQVRTRYLVMLKFNHK
eukprot:TRINITY_DN207_c10_g1_i1.p1 TRINITY_DN207_c10_g1~~TRINITY_DN207_c10_g1_i1.p1  ORF type:complete len:700 (+),score=209.68 TRINITY_DN207_c10_g1_i1:28-2100(+)